jgi:small-conductance mechanosensitive channel
MVSVMDLTALTLPDLSEWLTPRHATGLLRVVLLLGLGIPVFRLAGRGLFKLLSGRASEQSAMLARKVVVYAGTALVLVMCMRELGFKLTTLLGAAGIAGIAIGFAAQTSLSNLISGLFLVWEKPVQVGDVIVLGDTTGVVHSIDLLSLQLRTFDNKFVRIPNESLLKSQFTNVTFPA